MYSMIAVAMLSSSWPLCWITVYDNVVSPYWKMGAWNGPPSIFDEILPGKILQVLVATVCFHRVLDTAVR